MFNDAMMSVDDGEVVVDGVFDMGVHDELLTAVITDHEHQLTSIYNGEMPVSNYGEPLCRTSSSREMQLNALPTYVFNPTANHRLSSQTTRIIVADEPHYEQSDVSQRPVSACDVATAWKRRQKGAFIASTSITDCHFQSNWSATCRRQN